MRIVHSRCGNIIFFKKKEKKSSISFKNQNLDNREKIHVGSDEEIDCSLTTKGV